MGNAILRAAGFGSRDHDQSPLCAQGKGTSGEYADTVRC